METKHLFLIIDDNAIDQIIATQLLKKVLGATKINSAANGNEAIKWIRNNRTNYSETLIILLDIKMPEMDGFEFLTKYDTLAEGLKKETQIFMLSSTLDPHDIQRAESNPYVKALLSKPLPIKEFRDMIYPDLSSKTA
jgi:CheY-like chemotaxis protein